MTNEEVKIYSKEKTKKVSAEGFIEKLKRTGYGELLEYAVMFMLFSVRFLGNLSPLGIAYFAAAFPTQRRSFGIFFACLGVVFGRFGIESLKYMGAVAIVAAFSIFLKEEIANKKVLYGLLASLSVLSNGFIYVAFDGFLVYDILFLMLESIIAFFAYFAFEKSVCLIRTVKTRNYFETEETLSLLILCAGIILALKNLPFCSPLAHIISISVLLTLGYSSGAQASSAAGIVLGLVNAIGEPLAAQTVSVYSLCGFGCGMFKSKGKWAVCLSFLVINAFFMMYFNSSMDRLLTVGYIAVGTAVLYLLPASFLMRFGEIAESADNTTFSPQERLKEVLCDKLTSASASFSELSGIFSKIVDSKLTPELCDIDRVYDRTYNAVCKNCSMNKYCWQSKANDTYDCLGKMHEMMKVRGYAIDIDAPKHFKEYCINFNEFLLTLNKEYEKFRLNLMWAGKIIESRKLISDQFGCISSVLGKIKKDVGSDFSENIRLERKILTSLDKKGILVSNVCVLNNSGYEVTMSKDSCNGNLECSKIIASVISEILEVPMLRVNRKCSGDVCRLRFCEQARFKIETGSATAKKSGENKSGDSFSCMFMPDGKYVCVLSDGAGSGKRAGAQSAVTVEMLKRLLNVGFDKETSVRLINSILISNNEKDVFATIDICIVNLYTGTAEFLKTGAAPSYIKKADSVEEIFCSSIPAGLITGEKSDCAYREIKNGEYIVMVTDGVIESTLQTGKKLSDILGSFSGESPQMVADAIMSFAVAASKGSLKDDMTVFVIKVSEEM